MTDKRKLCVNCEYWEGCSGFYLANCKKRNVKTYEYSYCMDWKKKEEEKKNGKDF